MVRFRKRPLEVAAVRWTGDNAAQIKDFVGCRQDNGEPRFLLPEEISGVWETAKIWAGAEHDWLACPVGHWVIRGIRGEFYPCADDVFKATYEPIV